jgi:hypothetical protein
MSCMSTGRISLVVLGVSESMSAPPLFAFGSDHCKLTLHESLPDMDRGLSDDAHRVLPDDVQRSKHAVPSFLPESLEKRLAGRIRTMGRRLVLLELDFAADTSDTVQQLASEGDGRLLVHGPVSGSIPKETRSQLTLIRHEASSMPFSSSGRSRSMALFE